MPHDTRDSIVDFVRQSQQKTEIPIGKYLAWLGIRAAKFSDWKMRYGKVNEHNRCIPRDHWIESWEKETVLKYYQDHPLEGYRRLAFMMLDENVVALSPASVYRILCLAGVMRRWSRKVSKKGTGFQQPQNPHEHWHIDVSYLNIAGTFYYLCCVLDGYSRYIVHWEIRAQMKEADVEIILERAKEKYPDARPRIISDNGPQFIARDFKELIRISGMTHVRSSPFYPQSNGKLERFHQTIKGDCIRRESPGSAEEARLRAGDYIRHYNEVRLHSAIGYVSPLAKLQGREAALFEARDQKLEAARERRKKARKKLEKQEGKKDV